MKVDEAYKGRTVFDVNLLTQPYCYDKTPPMMRQTISPSKIKQYAKAYVVDFSYEKVGGEWSVDCYSPRWRRWRSTGTHFLALPADGFYGTPDWRETLDVLRSEIAYGFEKCDDKECDICHPV